MMHVIAAILAGTVACAICHGWLIRRLRNHYSRPAAVWPADRPWPKVAIVLSLRGKDPFLEMCLRNLLRQDYPDFVLQIVVDSETDPAWEAIHAIQSECDGERLKVSVLHDRRASCSLKNSSIIQAINSLPDDRELVAFVDADAIAHPTWLRCLVTPLADPEVGCSTGVRWFAPADQSLATRLRCYWNLFAAPVIYHSQIPWGGSMVVRRSVLDSGLTEEWSRMFCEDAHTINHLQRRGLKLACVPAVTVVNHETTTVAGCFRFFNRQMLIFRLYHRQWWPLVAMIVFATVLRFTHFYYILQSLIYRDWINCLALICIYAIIPCVTQYEARHLDAAVRKMVRKTGQEIARNPAPELFFFFCAEAMSVGSMLAAFTARFVNWRGISYRVDGPKNITMLAYRPFVLTPAAIVAGSESVI